MMTKHTPGPWKLIWHGNEIYPFPLSVHTEDDDCWIARDGTVSSEANARLIAAAPDLLAALELMVNEFAMMIEEYGGSDSDSVMNQARAAIATARL